MRQRARCCPRLVLVLALCALGGVVRVRHLRAKRVADWWCRKPRDGDDFTQAGGGLVFDPSANLDGAAFEVKAAAMYAGKITCHGGPAAEAELCVATIAGGLPRRFLDALRANRLAFTRARGYAYCETDQWNAGRQASWSKLLMLAALRRRCPRMLWLDADALFTASTGAAAPTTTPAGRAGAGARIARARRATEPLVRALRRHDAVFTAALGPKSLPWPYSGVCAPGPRFERAPRDFFDDVVDRWEPGFPGYPYGVLNAGILALRGGPGSNWTRDWLAKIYMRPYGILPNQSNTQWAQCAGKWPSWEQGAINRWLVAESADARARVAFFLQQHLNTMPCEWRPGARPRSARCALAELPRPLKFLTRPCALSGTLVLHAAGVTLGKHMRGAPKFAFLAEWAEACVPTSPRAAPPNMSACAERLCPASGRKACVPRPPARDREPRRHGAWSWTAGAYARAVGQAVRLGEEIARGKFLDFTIKMA